MGCECFFDFNGILVGFYCNGVRWDFRSLIGYLINSLILMMLGTSENGIYHGFIMVNPRDGNLNEEHDDTPLVLRVPQMG